MLLPMFALVLLTFIVALILFILRYRAVKSGQIKISQFRLNNSNDIPDKLIEASRNYANLFEIPVLFYVACCLALILNMQTLLMIILAWGFVITRVIHSWIHLTSNNVVLRMQAFMLGNILVFAMWILLLLRYLLARY